MSYDTAAFLSEAAKRPLVIIESPHAGATVGGIEDNIAYARAAVRNSVQRGESPIASHLLFTQPGILDDGKPFERELGIQCGYSWYFAAEKIIFYVDKGYSPGMIRARETAKLLNLKMEERLISVWDNGAQNNS